jgi:hypothetical protein
MKTTEELKNQIKKVIVQFEIADNRYEHVDFCENDYTFQYNEIDYEISLTTLSLIQSELSDFEITLCGTYSCGISLNFKYKGVE